MSTNNKENANSQNVNNSSGGYQSSVLVLDCGSGFIKAGFAGEDAPRVVLPNVLLDHHGQALPAVIIEAHLDRTEYLVGSAAIQAMQLSDSRLAANTNPLSLLKPVERGEVKDWDSITKIWDHIFKNELHISPKDHPVMITVSPLCSQDSISQIAKILFEVFHVPAICMANQAVLSLFSTGRTTGVVVEVGEGMAYAVPVYEGFALRHAVLSMPVSGVDVTKYLMKGLGERGFNFVDSQTDTVRDIKEKLCRVKPEATPKEEDKDSNNSSSASLPVGDTDETSYELPDGQMIRLDDHCRFATFDILFDPTRINLSCVGIHKMTYQSLQMCDAYLRKELVKNIVLAGGTSMAKGFGDRMKRELGKLLEESSPSEYPLLNVITDSQRKYAAWIGASMYSSLPTFNLFRISQEEFKRDDMIVYKKFFC